MAFPRIGGPGIGLSPSLLGSNSVTLFNGATYLIPAGTYLLAAGPMTSLQFFDPVMQQWRMVAAPQQAMPRIIDSDGANLRLANLTGCPTNAIITNAGTGYTNGIGTAQTGLTITPSAGGSTWVPVVGGAINSTITVTSGGSGYNFSPTVVASPPPAGGYPALVQAFVSGGAVSGALTASQGAGYRTAPTLTIIPDPRDTNAQGAVLTVNPVLVGSGNLLALYPSSNGLSLTSVPTLTFNPASTTAATVLMNFVVTSITVTGGGVAVPAGSGGIAIPNSSTVSQAANTVGFNYTYTNSLARPAYIQLAITGGVIQQTGTYCFDPGFGFQFAPVFGLQSSTGVAPTTGVNISLGAGGLVDINYLQPI